MHSTKAKNHKKTGQFPQMAIQDQALPLADLHRGYDPELLYVECGRCGAPVMWDEGSATNLLREAGIDPLELDPSCLLVTDGCPACAFGNHFTVQVCRVSAGSEYNHPQLYGNA